MVESPWGVEPQTYALRGRSRASLKFEVDAPTSANAFARLESTQVSAQLDPPRGRTACYGVAVGERSPRRYVAGTCEPTYRHEHQADARAHHFKRHFKRRLKIQYLAL